MAYRVVWSPRALDDIDSIASYIARDSAAYASAVVAELFNVYRAQIPDLVAMARVAPDHFKVPVPFELLLLKRREVV